MIPVLAVPVLVPRYVDAMLDSIDEPVERLLVIDNGAGLAQADVRLPSNIGVAAAWNLAIKLTPDAPWWAIVNDDLTFGPGSLARLAHAMTAEPGPRIVTLCRFSAFGINAEAIDAVGFFDENYHPAYVEDCDYEYRCRRAGVPIVPLSATVSHLGSATIREAVYAQANQQTYRHNYDYHEAKWGGHLRGGERYETPFNRGGDVGDWRLELDRLRRLRWPDQRDGARRRVGVA